MKTKTLLLICLMSVVGFAQLSAQSYSSNFDQTYSVPVFCNGVQVDFLTGTVSTHSVVHLQNGNYIWGHYSYHGTVTGQNNESFTINENYSEDGITGIVTYHYNLNGNQGHHYIGTFSWDPAAGPYMENIVIEHSLCL